MIRTALIATLAAPLLLAGPAHAQTNPSDKPAPKTAQPAKPDTKAAAAKPKRVNYSCDGGVTLAVTYPPEAQAKARPVKIALKDTTYFVRPGKEAAAGKYENAKIKLVFQTKGDEATLEREGKPLAEKCKAAKPGT